MRVAVPGVGAGFFGVFLLTVAILYVYQLYRKDKELADFTRDAFKTLMKGKVPL